MALVNGQFCDTLDIADRGLAYGDGLFETIAYVNNQLHHWAFHWQRLKQGAKQLKLKMPDEQALLKHIQYALDNEENSSIDSNFNQCIVKVIVTRGVGGRGYMFPEQQNPNLIITLHEWPDKSVEDYLYGVKAVVCETSLAKQPLLAGIKHLNRLEQVLARNEFDGKQFHEGIMLIQSENSFNEHNLVIEGTSSNLFFVIDGQLCTPDLSQCGIKGTMRAAVIELAKKLNISIIEGDFSLNQLCEASEVFFTNSVYGIVPLASLKQIDNSMHVFEERVVAEQIAEVLNQAIKRPTHFGTL